MQNPVIVVPGITASRLRDEYPVDPETIWAAILNKKYDRVALHPDDLRFEMRQPSRVVPESVFELPYRELILELRHDLTRRADQPVPVYPFAYDWRMPLDLTESRLDAFVDEVIARTRLLKHYDRSAWARDPRVDLVGHSMGGMIVTGWLERRGRRAPVGKIVTLGTPFRGSLEAPIKVATGTAEIGDEESSSRDREAARLTPALYFLLPRFEGALRLDPGLPAGLTLYDVDAWQRGVVRTLAEFIRLHGLNPARSTARREAIARDLLGGMLQAARDHRDRIDAFRLGRAGLDASRWLCVVGVNERTRTGLRVRYVRGAPEFDLTGKDRRDGWESDDPALRVHTGDGTVPYLGARPRFLGVEHLVCVRPVDFGYWEVGDRLLRRPAGLHAMLPKLNLAHRLIVSHLTGTRRKGTWGRPAPDLGNRAWNPPIRGLELKD